MRYFEDYKVGDRKEVGSCRLKRDDIVQFAKMWDPQPFHLDEIDAKSSIFGELIASGCHLMAMAINVVSRSPYRGNVLAAVGWDSVRFLLPGRPGDTLTLTMECIEARASKSRPDRGIVRNKGQFVNQEGNTVMEFIDTIFVGRKPTESE